MNTIEPAPGGRSFWFGTAIIIVVLAWSGWSPYDRATWWMEVLPVLIAWPVIWATRRRFPLTELVFWLVVVHAIILIVGGAYTYARVPIGFQVQEWLELKRNPYDKLGHLAQGFIPVMVAREIFIRGNHVPGRKMRVFLLLSVVLGISAVYELLEWAAALWMGQGADEFLGTQGDEWDTQSDMFCALIGAAVALLTLGSWHDRQLRRVMAGSSLPRPSAGVH